MNAAKAASAARNEEAAAPSADSGAAQPAAASLGTPSIPVASIASQPRVSQFSHDSEFFNDLGRKVDTLPNFQKAATLRALIHLAYELSVFLPLNCKDLTNLDVSLALQVEALAIVAEKVERVPDSNRQRPFRVPA